MARVEVTLVRDGLRWVGRGDDFVVEAADFPELDERIKRKIVESRRFPTGTQVHVWIMCDRRVIPAWMRPYHSHYFNRIVSFIVGEGGGP